MRAKSPSTAARDADYSKLRHVFLKEHPICEAHLARRCTWAATEVHHKAGRSPSLFFRVDLWAALCHDCHVWVTNHPEEARARGLSVHSSAPNRKAVA